MKPEQLRTTEAVILCNFFAHRRKTLAAKRADFVHLTDIHSSYNLNKYIHACCNLVNMGYLETDDPENRQRGRCRGWRITEEGIARIENPASLLELPEEIGQILVAIRSLEKRVLRLGYWS